jgi:sodium-dependent dicarboxylate transporter 2/3/5
LGGGFAISLGFKDSGLSVWIADQMQGIANLPPMAILALLCSGTAAFTEFNSNVASASILLPLVARLAVTSGHNPLLFMVPVTLATSFAFCLPIATAPNAIAFGTGCMTVSDMIKVHAARSTVRHSEVSASSRSAACGRLGSGLTCSAWACCWLSL